MLQSAYKNYSSVLYSKLGMLLGRRFLLLVFPCFCLLGGKGQRSLEIWTNSQWVFLFSALEGAACSF